MSLLLRRAAGGVHLRHGELANTVFATVGAQAMRRSMSTDQTQAEKTMTAKVLESLAATSAEVKDVSGGCGTFYQITVASPKFEGLSVIKQHRLVNDVLKDEIAAAHGVTINTSTK